MAMFKYVWGYKIKRNSPSETRLNQVCGKALHINTVYVVHQLYCSEMICGNDRPAGGRGGVFRIMPVLPLQSDALSGALHPTSTKHGTEVLRPCTQDCPRNPKKYRVA